MAAPCSTGLFGLGSLSRMKPSPLHLRLGQLRRRLGSALCNLEAVHNTHSDFERQNHLDLIDQNTNEQSRDLPFLGLRPNPHHI